MSNNILKINKKKRLKNISRIVRFGGGGKKELMSFLMFFCCLFRPSLKTIPTGSTGRSLISRQDEENYGINIFNLPSVFILL
jgi:hypothetical protein